ncbi:large-conductance mechanosensitive channel protein MscL [Candidatus Kaiserbacteria bacterium]|nr:large-conductance mechanosensitive channel protein MscL [Candidatus Kaiserbacteria bacterium]
MLQEFKEFAMKGNVVDLAVAVVIGAAFGKIVSSLVDNLITPLVGLFLGGVDFSGLSYSVGDAVFGYGAFIQSVIDFTIVAFVIFLLVKAINKAQGPEEAKEEAPAGPTEVELLTEIRDQLRRG